MKPAEEQVLDAIRLADRLSVGVKVESVKEVMDCVEVEIVGYTLRFEKKSFLELVKGLKEI